MALTFGLSTGAAPFILWLSPAQLPVLSYLMALEGVLKWQSAAGASQTGLPAVPPQQGWVQRFSVRKNS